MAEIGYLMMLFGLIEIIRIVYKINKLTKTNPEVEPLKCSKCGIHPIYIACPDHCYDCYIKHKWNDIDEIKPSHEVVLAACYTYDCGWTIDSAWWHVDNECWMTTGDVKSNESHLEYSHWRKMPDHPGDEIGYKKFN